MLHMSEASQLIANDSYGLNVTSYSKHTLLYYIEIFITQPGKQYQYIMSSKLLIQPAQIFLKALLTTVILGAYRKLKSTSM